MYNVYQKGLLININTNSETLASALPFKSEDYYNDWNDLFRRNNKDQLKEFEEKIRSYDKGKPFTLVDNHKYVYNGNTIYLHEHTSANGVIQTSYLDDLFKSFARYLKDHSVSMNISLIYNLYSDPMIYYPTFQNNLILKPTFSYFFTIVFRFIELFFLFFLPLLPPLLLNSLFLYSLITS